MGSVTKADDNGKLHRSEFLVPLKNGNRLASVQGRVYELTPCYEGEGKRIYFAYCRPLHLVKIGTARDVNGRLRQLQTGCPYEIELIALLDGGTSKEFELHQRFNHLRTSGEWFAVADELRDLIVALQETDKRINDTRVVENGNPSGRNIIRGECPCCKGTGRWSVGTDDF